MKKINMDVLESEVNSRTVKKTKKFHLGGAYKLKRLKENHRLVDVSSGVCCVSYLSKFENEKAILNDIQIEGLINKLNIKENIEDNYRISSELLDEYVDSLYLEDKNIVKKLYEKVKSFDDLNSYLIKFNYYLQIKDYVNASQISLYIYNLKTNMDDECFIIYLFLLSKLYLKMNNNLYGYRTFKLLLSLNVSDVKLKAIIFQIGLKYVCKLKLEILVYKYYNESNQLFLLNHNYEKVNENREIYINYLIENNYFDLAEEELKTFEKANEKENKFLEGYFFYKKKHYNKSRKILSELINYSDYEVKTKLILLDISIIKKEKNIAENIIIDLSKKNEVINNDQYKSLIEYYNLVLLDCKVDLKSHISSKLINSAIKDQNLQNLQFYFCKLKNILLVDSRYKLFAEATKKVDEFYELIENNK